MTNTIGFRLRLIPSFCIPIELTINYLRFSESIGRTKRNHIETRHCFNFVCTHKMYFLIHEITIEYIK